MGDWAEIRETKGLWGEVKGDSREKAIRILIESLASVCSPTQIKGVWPSYMKWAHSCLA